MRVNNILESKINKFQININILNNTKVSFVKKNVTSSIFS
jgi:hypothetical protein